MKQSKSGFYLLVSSESSEINVFDINSAHWADHWLHDELRIKNRIIPARCSGLTCQWEKGGKTTKSQELKVGQVKT